MKRFDPVARTTLALLALPALLCFPACSGGGGSGPAKGNLVVTSLSIKSPDPTSAHELDLEVGISATIPMRDVSVSYYVLHKADMDSGKAEPRQFLVQTEVLETVPAGDNTYPVTVIIPKDVGPKGDYYLTTRVDPLDQIEETNEDDNVPPPSQPDIVIAVNHDNLNTPDFIIEKVELDDPAIVLSRNLSRGNVGAFADKPDHHGGATAEFKVTGAKEFTAVSVQAKIELPGVGFRNLQIWREDQARYVTTHFVEVIPDQPNSVHVDFNIPESLRESLLAKVRAGDPKSNIQITLNVGDSIAEWELGVNRITDRPDDMVTLPVTLVDPDPPAPKACLSKTQSFDKYWHNKYLGCGIEFHAGAYLDGRGAVAEAVGALPVYVFNKRLDFFRGEAYGQLSPHKTEDTQFHIDVDILGQTVYHRASRDPKYVYTDTPFEKVETVERQSIVFVGPVPIVFKAGAQGRVGYRLDYEMDSGSMSLAGTPFAELTARASAVVELGVARGGLRGSMTLVREEFETKVTFGSVRLTNGGANIDATLATTITNTLTGPTGRLQLFAEYPGIKYCKTVVGRVPCGVTTHTKAKTIVKFATFKKVDVLLNERATASVSLQCQ